MPEPLSGYRILDLSWGVAGPIATMMLAEQGAEVIKVEPPGGDPFRKSAGYPVWNRSKQSVVLDLKADEGNANFLRLLETSDVLIESFRPGVMERLGLGYAELHERFPALVYLTLPGFPSQSAQAGRPGYDPLVSAWSGQQFAQAGPGRPDGPAYLYMPMASMAACFLAASAVNLALYERERSGRGQRIETSLLQGVLLFTTMLWQYQEHPRTHFLPKQVNTPMFPCADGHWVHIVPSGKGARDRLYSVLGLPLDLGRDPQRAPSPAERAIANQTEGEAFRRFSRADLLQACWDNDIPAQPVQPMDVLYQDPQLIANGMVQTVHDPDLGATTQIGIPFTLEYAPGSIKGGQPRVGEHTTQILSSLANAPKRPPAVSARLQANSKFALEGIRVLDLGQYLAGPFADMILADLGADVIKVEPVEGDAMRAQMSFVGCQRGKRDIALNLKDPAGLQVLYDLVRTADVVHHNMRVGVAERLKVDYATLKTIKPDLIYHHSPAYGVRGPRATWPGFDQLFQASTGCEYEQGGVRAGHDPAWYRFGMCDTGNAMLVVVAVTTALLHRQRTGEGGFGHTSLLNAGALFNSANFLTKDGPAPRPLINADQTGIGPDNRLYATADGWIQVCALRPAQWERFTQAIGMTQAPPDRPTEQRIEAALAQLSLNAAQTLLDQAGVPAEICRDTKEGMEGFLFDPELFALGLVTEYEHSLMGKMRQFGHTIFFSETPGRIQGPPPLVGQHSAEILRGLGYTEAQIAALHGRAVVYWPDEQYDQRFAL